MISPNERLTILELVQHPWLNSGIAPETVLQSPQYMMDKVSKAHCYTESLVICSHCACAHHYQIYVVSSGER